MTSARPIPLSLAIPIVFIWASGYPIGALGVTVAPPFLLTTARLLLASAVLATLALSARAAWPTRRSLGHTTVVGILAHGMQFGGAYGGMSAGIPASVTALIIAMNPVLTAALARWLLHERLGRTRLWGLAIGVLAVLVTLGGQVLAEGVVNPGIVLTLLGLFGFSAGGLYQQRFCRDVDIRAGGAVQATAGACAVGVLAAFERGAVTDMGQAGAVLVWLVLAGSVAGTAFYLRAVAVGGASRTSSLFSAVPAGSALLAWPVLGEVPSISALVGIALGAVACGLGTTTGPGDNRRSEVEERPVRT